MHNVRRVKHTEEQKAQRRKREQHDIQKFQKLNAEVIKRDFSDLGRVLLLTTQMLKMCPEHYTAWNVRREAILKLEEQDQKVYIDQLKHELEFTASLLPQNPKIHWIWNHRRWTAIRLGGGMEHELKLVNLLLAKDPRNFHGWTYRRWVLRLQFNNNIPASEVEKELKFTTEKINQNFSNYSAWHHRVQQLKQLPLELRPQLSAELEYVLQAVFMDPNDQSAWLYYTWLLEGDLYTVSTEVLKEQLDMIEELYSEDQTAYAARALLQLKSLLNMERDQKLVDDLIEMDPMHKNRYRV